MQERKNTHPVCPPVHRPTARVAEQDASSQQVDDVGEEDEADDGEKHQHQNVHHDGNTVGDGRCRRAAKDTQQKQQQQQYSRRCRRSAKIGNVREVDGVKMSSTLPPPPLPASKTGSEGT